MISKLVHSWSFPAIFMILVQSRLINAFVHCSLYMWQPSCHYLQNVVYVIKNRLIFLNCIVCTSVDSANVKQNHFLECTGAFDLSLR